MTGGGGGSIVLDAPNLFNFLGSSCSSVSKPSFASTLSYIGILTLQHLSRSIRVAYFLPLQFKIFYFKYFAKCLDFSSHLAKCPGIFSECYDFWKKLERSNRYLQTVAVICKFSEFFSFLLDKMTEKSISRTAPSAISPALRVDWPNDYRPGRSTIRWARLASPRTGLRRYSISSRAEANRLQFFSFL